MTEESKSGSEELDAEKKKEPKDERVECDSKESIDLQNVMKNEEDSQDRAPEEDQANEKQEEKADNSDEEEQESESSSSESESDSSKHLLKYILNLVIVTIFILSLSFMDWYN